MARHRRFEDPTHFFIRWWCRKYGLPPTDERLARYTLEELIVEYFEDQYDEDPKTMYSLDAEEDGLDAILTGDPLLDELERRIAAGEDGEAVMDELGIGDGAGGRREVNESYNEDESGSQE